MLDDVRVLDLSHLLPGQFATAMLAQLGAEVVTVEPPDDGDYLRQYPASYAAYNHTKRSVALDLKREEGRAAFLSLAEKADVVVEEFRPGVASRLGVDYEPVSDVNPSIVYCSVSGHGQDSPRADHVGHDLNYVGLTGMLDVAPKRDGVPLYPPVIVADMATAIFAAFSISAALHGDEGEHIDLSMTDAAVNTMSVHYAEYAGRGESFGWGDSSMLGGYPANAVYECADGEFLTVGAIEPHFWRALCETLDLTAHVEEQWPREESEREHLFDVFRARFRERTRDEWLDRFDQTEVPVAPVNRLEEVFEDEELTDREVIRSVQQGDAEFPATTIPARFENHDVDLRSPPDLGEDTRPLLEDAGFSDAEIDTIVGPNDD